MPVFGVEQQGPGVGEHEFEIHDVVDAEHVAGQGGVDHHADAAGQPQAEQSTWQAEQSNHRRLGFEFTSDSPQKYLSFMRLLVEPLRKLLTGKLDVADQAFEAKQRELEKKAMASADVSNSGRSYRIMIAAMNIQERRALAKIHLLYQSEDMWSLMPDSSHTEA